MSDTTEYVPPKVWTWSEASYAGDWVTTVC